MARPRKGELQPRLAEYRHRAGLTQEQVAEHLDIKPEMVRRHERGINMPVGPTRKKYCRLYGATEEDLGFRTALPNAVEVKPRVAKQSTPAEFADSDYLEKVHGHIREIIDLDNRFGGVDLVKLSTRFFAKLDDQLGKGAYDPKLESDLQSAAGELAEVAGWLAYDAEEHQLARRMNQESLFYTRLSGDKETELLTLQNSSMHAAAQGRPQEALNLACSVLQGNYRLSARLRGLFLTRKARAMAQRGDEKALEVFPEIYSLYLDGVRDGDPAWAWWVDERELLWHEAMAQRDLGLPFAVEQFERSAAAVPSDEKRSQFVHGSHLLQAHVDNRSWNAAEEVLARLIPLSKDVASTRAVVLLRDVLSKLDAQRPLVSSGLLGRAAQLDNTLSDLAV